MSIFTGQVFIHFFRKSEFFLGRYSRKTAFFGLILVLFGPFLGGFRSN